MSRPRLKTYSPINGDCGLEYRGLDMNGEFVVTSSDVCKMSGLAQHRRIGVLASIRDGLRHDQLQAQLSSQGGPLTPAKVGSVWLRAESNAPPVS
jgi:hypothetical protein